MDNKANVLNYLSKAYFNTIHHDATMPFPVHDEQFDNVHCANFIEHLYPHQLRNLLIEMDRVLKQGGLMCIRGPLMHKGFYLNHDHIRPYYPSGIYKLMYEKSRRHPEDFQEVKGEYEMAALHWKRNKWFQKTGFMLVMVKL